MIIDGQLKTVASILQTVCWQRQHRPNYTVKMIFVVPAYSKNRLTIDASTSAKKQFFFAIIYVTLMHTCSDCTNKYITAPNRYLIIVFALFNLRVRHVRLSYIIGNEEYIFFNFLVHTTSENLKFYISLICLNMNFNELLKR